MVPPVLLKYSTYARVACCAAVNRPGTGPLMSEELPIRIVSFVMPGPFLNPAQEAPRGAAGAWGPPGAFGPDVEPPLWVGLSLGTSVPPSVPPSTVGPLTTA